MKELWGKEGNKNKDLKVIRFIINEMYILQSLPIYYNIVRIDNVKSSGRYEDKYNKV